ncbi:hypothetical protein HZB74_01575 [Candidatus Saccharibacteria bacterium]|nr:hypothetical protein [Candidatus Saccharibacteria bacterium]
MEELKVRFNKIYAGLPLGLRNDIVVVIDPDGPITWHAAYIEVYNNTDKGKEILGKLAELEII